MSQVTLTKANALGRRQSPPKKPVAKAASSGLPQDTFIESQSESKPSTYSPSWAAARTQDTKAKLSGGQVAALAMGSLVALGGLIGLGTNAMSPPPRPEAQAEVVTETESIAEQQSQVSLAVETQEVQEVQEAQFSDGRQLLVDRSERVHADQFRPDPSQAISERGKFISYSEDYIASLVDRHLTEVPEGQPNFTAYQVDPGQSSKIYHDAELNEVGFGYGSIRTGDFFTRPNRMKQGNGIRDEITQHQLSAVYRLESPAVMDGVQLEPGLYRVITLSPSSRVATPAMHKAVAPGHRLIPSGSGIRGDYTPVQTDDAGNPLKVNPDDIVQVWSLTEAEAANFNN